MSKVEEYLRSSIWQHQFYYLFGFLFLVLVILIVTCSEVKMTERTFMCKIVYQGSELNYTHLE